MRIILDTNIIINSEDDNILDDKLTIMHSLAEKHGVQRLIHKKSEDDIKKDKNVARQKKTLSKLAKYPILDFDNKPDTTFESICGKPIKTNDEVDNYILYALYKGAASYLVTEDRGIHSKALKLGLRDRVATVNDFNNLLITEFELVFPELPSIKEKALTEIDSNDLIFDSLKKDYPGFEKWLRKKASEGRKAWVIQIDKSLDGICIYDPKNKGCDEKMKICTFKISENSRGNRIGELLLRQAMIFAYENTIDTLFIEVKKDKDEFIEWLKDFGFFMYGKKNEGTNDEEYILKKLIKPIEKTETQTDIVHLNKIHFPYYVEPPSVNSFIIPIRPVFTKRLFPDLEDQPSLPGFSLPCGNAIRKAYVCKTQNRQITIGDVIFFYESKRKQSIIAVGFIEEYLISTDLNKLLEFIGKISVYSIEDIKNLMRSSKELVVIKFRYCFSYRNIGHLQKLIKNTVLKSAPQSITSITSKYEILKKLLE